MSKSMFGFNPNKEYGYAPQLTKDDLKSQVLDCNNEENIVKCVDEIVHMITIDNCVIGRMI